MGTCTRNLDLCDRDVAGRRASKCNEVKSLGDELQSACIFRINQYVTDDHSQDRLWFVG